MKKLLFIAATLVTFSCSNPKDTDRTADGLSLSADSAANGIYKAEETPDISEATSSESIETSYVGDFEAVEVKESRSYYYKNKINISLDSIRGDKAYGHSVVAGNERPFSGTCEFKDGGCVVTAKEPGDDKYDGKFDFTIDPNTMTLEGTWTANNTKLEVNKRKYKLKKAEFVYNASNVLPESLGGEIISEWNTISKFEDVSEMEQLTGDVNRFNASVSKLKKEDVENMFKGDLELTRNSIYARHGYSFKNRKMRYIFDNLVDWYIPVTTDVRNQLTKLEKENIELIKRYEEHADKYYDSYGR